MQTWRVVAPLLAGCAGEPPREPGPGAFDPDFETSADFFTQMDGPTDAGSVHGEMQIWYSVNLRDLLVEEKFAAPEGSVAIKRQTEPSGAVVYNAMVRLADGDSPDGEDWRWEQRDDALTVTLEGAVGFCVDCHVGYPDRDLLAGTEIR